MQFALRKVFDDKLYDTNFPQIHKVIQIQACKRAIVAHSKQ